ncbi:MAG: GNAT family N-acetyltransferase, partial [Psittacicella sp.]
ILGKRGRGKSFLSSRIISFLGSENCILLSSSKPSANSLKSLENLEFCTPTDIFKTKNTSKILFIEEASNISSSVILKLQNIFIKIIYISTVLGYEGTRDGFIKYILPRNSLILNPKKPLRWKEGDDLEVYSDLLSFREDIFINNSNILFSNPYNVDSNDGKSNILEIQDIEFLDVSYFKNTQNILSLYKLLLDAHYQNTLTDLMRLLDGKNILCGISYKNSLIGGLWAFDEGNIFDIKLQNEIFKGNRRPKGNLAVQMLYYFYGDRKLLSLSSLRISRIAVSKEFQSSGIGSLLISKLKSQAQNSYKDFISVSFSFVKSTYKFWLKNGFKLVYISKRISTVTARPQYIMIYPISVLAVKMLQNLEKSFLKDLDVDLCLCKIGDVNRVSYLDIKKFALFLRKNQSLDSALPSMLRILKFSYENSFISKVLFENSIKRLSLNSSKKDILQFINYNFKNLK